MSFTDEEIERYLDTIETEFWAYRRPPLNLRDKIREGQKISGQSIELFFARPAFQRPGEWNEDQFAKVKYSRARDVWTLYWHRADLKWHVFKPYPEAATLSEALAEIHCDPHCCFFG